MADRGQTVANLDDIKFNADLPLIDQIGKDSKEAIKLLGRAGINDAYLWVRKPGELSDGQRYRFRLAKAMESGADVWVADEFLAVLDRTSAKVIAFALQKVARQVGVTVLVATTHTDMVADLFPDLVIEKRFREKVRVEAFAEAKRLAMEKPITREDINDLLLRSV